MSEITEAVLPIGTAAPSTDPVPDAPTDVLPMGNIDASPMGDSEPDNYSAEYVHKLREENAAARVKSKRVDDANARLAASYAAQDGRLIDADALTFTEDMLDAEGLVDRERVTEAIGALLESKPYLQSRRPTAPLPQGAREDVPSEPGLFGLMRGY